MAVWDSNLSSWEWEEAPKYESSHRNRLSKKDRAREAMSFRSYVDHGIYSQASNDLDFDRPCATFPSTVECSKPQFPNFGGIHSKPNVCMGADPENNVPRIAYNRVHIGNNGYFAHDGVVMPRNSIKEEGVIEGDNLGFELQDEFSLKGNQTKASSDYGKIKFLDSKKGTAHASYAELLTEEQYSTNNTLQSGSSGDSLTGLHLGKKVYSQSSPKTVEAKKAQEIYRIDLKKPKAGGKIAKCQVQGCGIDLSSAKSYHQKHKVCEAHSKAVKVVVAGLEQRFCQQCSRFHRLSEFDDAKRSCRRRLAGHNERRRKPQPDPLAIQSRLQASLQEWSFLQHPKFAMAMTASLPQGYQDLTWPECILRQCEDRPSHYDLKKLQDVPAKGFNPLSCDNYIPPRQQSPRATDDFSSSLAHGSYGSFPLHQQSARTMPATNDFITSYSRTPSSLPTAAHADIFSGYEIVPLTGSVDRVRDYGRALSLLSPHWSSDHQAPHSVAIDLSGRSNMTKSDHHEMYEASAPQHEAGHHHPRDLCVEKMVQFVTIKAQAQQLSGESDKHNSFGSNTSMLTTMPYLWDDDHSVGR